MKKGLITFLAIAALFGATMIKDKNDSEIFANAQSRQIESSVAVKTAIEVRAKSAFACDYSTGEVIYSKNEIARLPIASMCKIMTLILCFDGLAQGKCTLEEEITVSERAASMGGSQVFLEGNAKYPIKELIKSIVVCSANDSCVAMAEYLAGSEELFVQKMNERAKQLGAENTLFANCTGLPKEPQYSCAKDVAIMLKELLKHKEYYEFGGVWMDKFMHPKGRYTEITNTNKLIRFYDGCDGGKTGFTNQAGFCLAATAKRKDMRIISVVIGAENSKNRFDDTKMLFDYAFANYQATPIVKQDVPLETEAAVLGGRQKTVAVLPQRSVFDFTKKGEKGNVHIEVETKPLRAPIAEKQVVGELIVYKDNVEMDRVPLVAASAVEKNRWFDSFKDAANAWNHK